MSHFIGTQRETKTGKNTLQFLNARAKIFGFNSLIRRIRSIPHVRPLTKYFSFPLSFLLPLVLCQCSWIEVEEMHHLWLCPLHSWRIYRHVWQSPSPWWYPPEIHEGFALLTASQGGKMRGRDRERGWKCETKHTERWMGKCIFWIYVWILVFRASGNLTNLY